MKKIWFDTDIGNDIDDSVALAYLLKHPECDLLGISTVSGETMERAMLADVICRAAGRRVPIFPGIEEPILTPQRQAVPHQKEHLPHFLHDTDYPKGRAIEEMYGAIAANPGEVTLVAVGPMTNVALLLKTHPDAAALLKDIVLMCGEFFGRSSYRRCENEWNSFCDPYASAIVYAAKGVRVRSAGLDVTSLVTLDHDEVLKRFTSPLLKTVYAFSDMDTGRRKSITFHDPLAAVSVFRPGVMEYRRGKVSVELSASRVIGRTYFDGDDEGAHEVGYTVDTAAFFEEYFKVANSL